MTISEVFDNIGDNYEHRTLVLVKAYIDSLLHMVKIDSDLVYLDDCRERDVLPFRIFRYPLPKDPSQAKARVISRMEFFRTQLEKEQQRSDVMFQSLGTTLNVDDLKALEDSSSDRVESLRAKLQTEKNKRLEKTLEIMHQRSESKSDTSASASPGSKSGRRGRGKNSTPKGSPQVRFDGHQTTDPAVTDRLSALERENLRLKKTVWYLKTVVSRLERRVTVLDGEEYIKPQRRSGGGSRLSGSSDSKKQSNGGLNGLGENDDEDLYEDAPEAEHESKKTPGDLKLNLKSEIRGKTSYILDVKAIGDETDMSTLERSVRNISLDGVIWGESKQVADAKGRRLEIACVAIDPTVNPQNVLTVIKTNHRDIVGSVDITSSNKL